MLERNGNECKHKECRNEKEKRVNPRRISFLSSVKNAIVVGRPIKFIFHFHIHGLVVQETRIELVF